MPLRPLKHLLILKASALAALYGCGIFPKVPQLSRTTSLKPKMMMLVDSNRDGTISDADATAEEWLWHGRGAFVLPNVDDDDSDGKIDCADTIVNTSSDEKDLTPLEIRWADTASEFSGWKIEVKSSSSQATVRWFLSSARGWKNLEKKISFAELAPKGSSHARLALEICQFASPNWDGFVHIHVYNNDDQIVQSFRLRASPFLMIPNTEKVDSLFVSSDSTGRYENTLMKRELFLQSMLANVRWKSYTTDIWQEMWMQDTMEIGYSESPTSRMHVVLNAPRGSDRFGRSLLGPDVGYIEVAEPRTQANPTDGWLDWFGNLEVSPPTERFPHGRIYFGANPDTQNTLHPEVIGFLEAQELQKPVALNTGWLFIKHVDEMLTFWPQPFSDDFVAVMPSPTLAHELLKTESDPINAQVQEHLEAIAQGDAGQPAVTELFGFEKSNLLYLPLLYNAGEHGATGRWSNPVNSVSFNSSVLYGNTDIPEAVHTFVRRVIREKGLRPLSIDDSAYQPRLGNVHCATNTLRRIPSRKFWTQ